MGKRLLNLYVEDSQVELAKAKNINLSALFREMINVETTLVKGDEFQNLKIENAKMKEELINLKAKLEKALKDGKPTTKRYTRIA